jgi:hypothetical protein
MAGGRPKKYTDELIAELLTSIHEYTANTEIPILKEWCVSVGVPSTHVYDFEEFSEPIKVLIDKKEAALERKALDGEVNTTMAVFSLKQLGWSDRQQVEHSAEAGFIRIIMPDGN